MIPAHDRTKERPQEISLATRYIDLGACLAIAELPAQAARLYRMALRVDPDNELARRALQALNRSIGSTPCPTRKS